MSVAWDDETDTILDGDLTAALSYRTPLGGAVVQAVAPIGLRDRAAGTVGFTTSLGFSRKLDGIARDPRVALAFHARDHGPARSPRFVLVQGRATVIERPSAAERRRLGELSAARLGAPRRGRFWDWWLREYYQVRVPVHVAVERIVTWPDPRCEGPASVAGAPLPDAPPPPQRPPAGGTAARLDAGRARGRLGRVRHVLLGFAGADGFPVVVPVRVDGTADGGLALTAAAPLPPGGRRAGLLGHDYRPQLVGLESHGYTGWLEVAGDGRGRYAPHTETGFRAPANKTLLLLLNGGLAKRGVRRARRLGTLPG
jgi:hypothetical protein